MFNVSSVRLGGYMLYHRKAMGTMKYSKWQGGHGGLSHFYGRTIMREEVKEGMPVSMVDRQMMNYVHRSRLRHFQLFLSYQQKSHATQNKLREGEMLRRAWQRKVQKAFISFIQFKTMKTLEEQAALVTRYGQASVNAALGEEKQYMETDEKGGPDAKKKQFQRLHRQIQRLPSVQPIPKHVATMKQIHNDRFNHRWRVN
ncbi:hypothetical protein AGDE_04209 [Angomonas deanei]|uniref:Uncharacterized protein n=1 Tax=Angomonas deanei TaxID=59799 RepID=S9VFI2_9TRYP|nr:hypothetical protein AGDE_06857 [Angomonas deanei]EPY39716.1 hypothetical protein AGDE_04212 [Angomonas deanei]EPY39719.1 hypothetical protein AGDE_04209 [Angomonas deanei]CAD2218536.1 hypothetical protein, conserved [Angomonas deanei]|eukprot:EPY36559.1 hypothetical protein AGDE_06857 [Angomonas deanei]